MILFFHYGTAAIEAWKKKSQLDVEIAVKAYVQQ